MIARLFARLRALYPVPVSPSEAELLGHVDDAHLMRLIRSRHPSALSRQRLVG
ncbi:MAG: hypothetical protein ABL879_11565 [Devosia sp.]